MLKKFEEYIPYLLPLLLFFYRGLADTTVCVIVLVFIFQSYKNSNWAWAKVAWFQYSLLFTLFIVFFNVPFSVNPTNSFYYAIAFLRWPIFASALIFWIFNSDVAIKKFLIALALLVSFIILDLWLQFFLGYDIFGYAKVTASRLSGPLRDNAVVGFFVVKYVCILFTSVIVFKKNYSEKTATFFLIFLSLIGFLTILITGERMSLILFLSIIVVALLISLFFSNKKSVFILTKILLLSLSLYLLGLTYPDVILRGFFSSIEKIQNLPSSDYGVVYRTAYLAWLENPYLGGGFHQFKAIYPLYNIDIWKDTVILHPHNHVFSLLSETGIIGLILYYLTVFHIFKLALMPIYKTKNWPKLFLISILLYIVFFPFMTHYSFHHNWMNATNWLTVGFALALSNRRYG